MCVEADLSFVLWCETIQNFIYSWSCFFHDYLIFYFEILFLNKLKCLVYSSLVDFVKSFMCSWKEIGSLFVLSLLISFKVIICHIKVAKVYFTFILFSLPKLEILSSASNNHLYCFLTTHYYILLLFLNTLLQCIAIIQ